MIDLRLILLLILSLKTCTRCGEMKFFNEFYSNGPWTMPHCKVCESTRKRIQYVNSKLTLKPIQIEMV